MDIFGALVRLLLGAGIGFCIGLTGIGGGVLVLPALTVLLGMTPSSAVGTASLYSFLTKASAAWHHGRLRTIDLGACARYLAGGLPANILASVWVNRFLHRPGIDPSRIARFQSGLGFLVTGVVILVAVTLVIDAFRSQRGARPGAAADRPGAEPEPPHVTASILMGAVIGFLIGLTSVGGGVVLIPSLMLTSHLSPARTVGTSLLITVALTFTTSLVYFTGGELMLSTALIMSAGSLAGAYWGSHMSARVSPQRLKWILAAMVTVAAGMLTAKALHVVPR